jgi:hypothetical protein
MVEIRNADLARDLPAVRSLWLDYLGWGISGFVDNGPCAKSEIPDEYKKHWVFMEKVL